MLLREVEGLTGIVRQFAGCFEDHRDPELIEHTAGELVAQRVYALALGYEDLNDHDRLRHDAMLGVLAGKTDPTGEDRIRLHLADGYPFRELFTTIYNRLRQWVPLRC